jgi:hypothetical protein
MFRITRGIGFHMTFDNGWTVSVQFGPFSRVSNRTFDVHSFSAQREFAENGSPDAEVAVWDGNGTWAPIGDGDAVRGWVSAEEVAELLSVVSKFPMGSTVESVNVAPKQIGNGE